MNVKMPTIVVILTFIRMINTSSESRLAREVFISDFSFYLRRFRESRSARGDQKVCGK